MLLAPSSPLHSSCSESRNEAWHDGSHLGGKDMQEVTDMIQTMGAKERRPWCLMALLGNQTKARNCPFWTYRYKRNPHCLRHRWVGFLLAVKHTHILYRDEQQVSGTEKPIRNSWHIILSGQGWESLEIAPGQLASNIGEESWIHTSHYT